MGDGRHPTEELRADRLTEHRLGELEKGRDEDARRWERIEATLGRIETALALGEQRMDAIDTHLEHTDSDVVALRADSAKSDPKSLWTGIGAAATALAALWAALSGSGEPKQHHPDRTEQTVESHK